MNVFAPDYNRTVHRLILRKHNVLTSVVAHGQGSRQTQTHRSLIPGSGFNSTPRTEALPASLTNQSTYLSTFCEIWKQEWTKLI